MHYNAAESGGDIMDKLVREYTCTRSTRWLPLKLHVSFIDVACVNACVLWMLKYPNWYQKKNNQGCLYLLSLGKQMVTPHIRRRADSVNVNRPAHMVMRAMSVT
jgi:hypothetical protein